jgi:hypothetical protein
LKASPNGSVEQFRKIRGSYDYNVGRQTINTHQERIDDALDLTSFGLVPA